ncbi:flagellar hook-basal body complex protein FliE [Cytobacillus horneckiae]|uniref:Flagellar hook-basal body complex protein FliE n=1 Tax=Cytobacillus horneckiae TaxID=549687 RepID=A0A2N0ZM26_9BACI|nr:flagellar hook-basal body complex protein FliE [Cytobacillus horneckiae]NRG43411.1 flagellar hook-basal body complex protein FliE [Bacillus sp. CRN 9]MBN6887160.1 flagellar hook-basal body complex protein FliE [Cytobacillus horneckiae]MCM3178249.1 flagellar hook-basal body complex protein FliE [Cytobacillus horneckiae]MEC1157011.1 flagellar hook-basal body complex protein FliE [Cytobacillus horneckiae]MED2939963.1 flagellar hook-basal body complex protein FliE [Cytobacillus horneckiae]
MNNVTFSPVIQKLDPVKQTEVSKTVTPNEVHTSFAEYLKNSIETVNDAQIKSDQMTEKLARGENVDLHDVMIASQKASVSVQLTMEVRNKAVEAYQEVMRMQV